SNQADIVISGTYTGSPTAIEASFNGGSYVTIDASPSGGTFSDTLTNQAAGQGALIVRYSNDSSSADTVNNVGVGDIFVIAGQSNASGRGNTMNTYSHSTLKASLFGNDDVWKELTDATDDNTGQVDGVSSDGSAGGTPWPIVATSILANTGVPVAFVPTAKGGTSIAQWQPGANHADASTLYGSMNRRITAVGGAVAGVIFYQGERDANLGTTQAAYEAGLNTVVDTIFADFPGTKTIIGQIGQSSFSGNDVVRAAQISVINSNANALLGPATYDINLSDAGGDGIHFKSDADMAKYAARWDSAINKAFYGGVDGYGPILDAANLVYDSANNKVLVPFLDESSPALSSASTVTPSSFELKNNGSSVSISGVSIVGDTIEITPASALNVAQPITLTYASLNSAVDSAIYDSHNLPAQPFYDVTVTVSTQPVPVELTYFNAEKLGDRDALITWETATELNNEGFEVYRSTDFGQTFEVVGFVQGQGSSNSTTEYKYIDQQVGLISSRVCYRLRQVDYDARYEFTPVICINFKGEENQSVYPNPTNGFVSLSFDNESGDVVLIEVKDQFGRLIKTISTYENNEQISLTEYANGVYYISIKGETFKLIKMGK
ncbi:MAG: T9SS type A sorting domain-containing protein, partial [Bacteroidia bacterium]|nr:T9SS type A sorting domain-containing protein [Bacteroidia bacterium]